MLTNIIEGLIFAAATGVTYDAMKNFFGGDYTEKEIKQALNEVREKYSGDNGIILIEYNNTFQFQTNPKYSDILADILIPIKERRLSQTVLQTLAIIAYRQPITKMEIEEVRGGVSSDYAIGILMKAELIEVKARKETLGRPSLYGTTDNFLKRFQLKSLADLPAYDELMQNIEESGKFNHSGNTIYEIKNSSLYSGDMDDEFFGELDEETPDFLEGEEIVDVQSEVAATDTTTSDEEPSTGEDVTEN